MAQNCIPWISFGWTPAEKRNKTKQLIHNNFSKGDELDIGVRHNRQHKTGPYEGKSLKVYVTLETKSIKHKIAITPKGPCGFTLHALKGRNTYIQESESTWSVFLKLWSKSPPWWSAMTVSTFCLYKQKFISTPPSQRKQSSWYYSISKPKIIMVSAQCELGKLTCQHVTATLFLVVGLKYTFLQVSSIVFLQSIASSPLRFPPSPTPFTVVYNITLSLSENDWWLGDFYLKSLLYGFVLWFSSCWGAVITHVTSSSPP